MTLHIASPVAHPERIRATLANLRSAFAVVTPYLTSVPLYGGLWMMACCSAMLDPRGHVAAARSTAASRSAASRDLQYYNGDMHRAALALPNFVRALVACRPARQRPRPPSPVAATDRPAFEPVARPPVHMAAPRVDGPQGGLPPCHWKGRTVMKPGNRT